MNFEPQHIYHIYNEGNNKQQLFNRHEDYNAYIRLFQSYCLPYCDVLAWCLLPNHFHFMVQANDKCCELKKQGGLMLDPLTNGFRKLLSAYAHDFNERNKRTGSLFRPKTKAKDLSQLQLVNAFTRSDYYINCFYFVNQNALLHGLVKDLYQWKYSSFLFYACSRDNDLCNKKLAIEICDYNSKKFPYMVLTRISRDYISLFEAF